jgi:hypothetical protein
MKNIFSGSKSKHLLLWVSERSSKNLIVISTSKYSSFCFNCLARGKRLTHRGSKKSRKPIFFTLKYSGFFDQYPTCTCCNEKGTKSSPAVAPPGKMLREFSGAVEVGKQKASSFPLSVHTSDPVSNDV